MRSLASRIALVSVVLVTFAVVLAVSGATLIGQRVADEAVTSSLSTSQSTQRYLQETTAREVALATDLLASDPYFTAYMVEAIRGGLETEAGIDTRSILDQVDARRVEMGFDFAMMLDQDGKILVRTDRPLRGEESRSDHPMVASVMDELIPDYGPWREGSRLYSAAVVPVSTAFELVGFLVTGMVIDNRVANQIKQVTGVDVVFLSASNSGTETVASTLDNEDNNQLLEALAGARGQALLAGEAIERLDVTIDNENWVGRVESIQDGAGTVLGAVITVDSLDAKLAGHRSIRNALIGAGLAAILIALVLSILVARRIAQPVSALAKVADQAAQGEYEQTIDTSGKDEVGTLARAISRLLADLREQKEIAGYVSELSRHLENSDSQSSAKDDKPPAGIETPPSGPAVIVALEWKPSEQISEGQTLESLQSWLPKLASIAKSNGARIAPGGGAKVYLIFSEGEQSGLVEGLGQLSALLDKLPGAPAMALASGDIVSAGLNLGPSRSPVITGKPIFHCERLLAEAGSGRMLISPPAFKQLKSRIEHADGGAEIVEGLRSKKKFYQMTPWPKTIASAETLPTSGLQTDAHSTPLTSVRPGTVLGDRYEILEHLGAGAMGTVFKARDRKLDDVVALKMLPASILADEENLERMKSEIRIARKITHPNVLRTHDLWEQDGQPVISMEYVRGIALSQLLEQSGKLKLAAGLRVCSQVLKGLSAAHQAGVLHRDIKPANIILDQSGNARLMDFGISHPIRSSSSSGTVGPAKIMGTANYMAPEIVSQGEVNERSDLYAMGVMMYEIFTGALPFKGGTAIEVCTAHVKLDAPSPSEHWPEIPRALEQIILTCMNKDPNQRYASAEALLGQLLKIRRQSAAATVGI